MIIMDKKQRAIYTSRKRKIKQWCKQILKKAKINDAECYFSDIPDHFEPVVIYSDVSNVFQTHSIEKDNMLTLENTDIRTAKIINVIEVKLKSDLKKYLIYRSTCKILELEMYDYWHKMTKTEIYKLANYLTKNEIRIYVTSCYHNYDKKGISDYMNKNSTLKALLTEKQKFRNNETEFKIIKQNILEEWVRVVDNIPLEHVVCYASEVVRNFHSLVPIKNFKKWL